MTNDKYICGIDPYGYDGRVSTFCVMKKDSLNPNGTHVVAMYSGGDKNRYEKELQEVIERYNISDENIIDFSDKQLP